MPITKSAKKALKVSRSKKVQNDQSRILLSKALKRVDDKKINETVSIIDKSAKRGIISKNKAARLKSRLMKKHITKNNDKVQMPNAKPASRAGGSSPKSKALKAKNDFKL